MAPFTGLAYDVAMGEMKQAIYDAIATYYGRVNLARKGIDGGIPPAMPELMVLLNQMNQFQALPLAGGLLDQPYQLMLELSWAEEAMRIFAPKEKPNAPSHQ